MIDTTVNVWGAERHPQYAAVVKELALLVWAAVQRCPPRYVTVECRPVRVLLEGEYTSKTSAMYQDGQYITICLGIKDVKTTSNRFRYIVAHELAHAYAPSVKLVRHVTRSGHDSDPVEKYADKIAALVVTDYSRQDFYKETPEW